MVGVSEFDEHDGQYIAGAFCLLQDGVSETVEVIGGDIFSEDVYGGDAVTVEGLGVFDGAREDGTGVCEPSVGTAAVSE